MKELDQMLARVHESCEHSSSTTNGPCHHHVRHRLYLRHLTARLSSSADRQSSRNEHHSIYESSSAAAAAAASAAAASAVKCHPNERNNNIQSTASACDGQVAAGGGGDAPSTSSTSEFGAAASTTSGHHNYYPQSSADSRPNPTPAIHLINGHPPPSTASEERAASNNHRQTHSPLLSGCRRKLYLHFNKTFLGGSGRPRWTSPPVVVEGTRGEQDGGAGAGGARSSRNKKHGFLRRRKTTHSAAAASSDIEERPSSLSGPSEDGVLTPPPLVRSPSVGQIDYADLGVPAAQKLFSHKRRPHSLDEHRMIAYNSSLLVGGPGSGGGGDGSAAPLQQPYQIVETVESLNGRMSSSGADSIGEHELPSSRESSQHRFTSMIPPAVLEVEAIEERSYEPPDRPPYLIGGNIRATITNGSGGVEDENDLHSDHEIDLARVHLDADEMPPPPELDSHQQEDHDHDGNHLDANHQVVNNAILTPVTLETFHRTHNRMCTSFRIKVPAMKNPVDACLLPDDYTAIADYDNGLLILNALGDLVQHRRSPNEVNACGVACTRTTGRLLLLVVRDGSWSINIYNFSFAILETVRCPTDGQIESWALRRLVISVDNRLHLLASGETKSAIWTYDLEKREWRTVLVENSGRKTTGNYNDMSVKYNADEKESRILLCEWKKAQLWSLIVNERTGAVEQRSIKMKRVKGQEWIVQGPHLAILDDHGDIVVYDGSGKLFLFDGDNYRCKKIVADVGRGEVSALSVSDGWVYALCRYRLCFDAYLYREEQNETNL